MQKNSLPEEVKEKEGDNYTSVEECVCVFQMDLLSCDYTAGLFVFSHIKCN